MRRGKSGRLPGGELKAATRDVETWLGAVMRSQATVPCVRDFYWTYTDNGNTALALIRLFQLRQHALTPGDHTSRRNLARPKCCLTLCPSASMAIPAPARDRFCVWGLCLATRRKVVCDEIGYVLKLLILRTSIH